MDPVEPRPTPAAGFQLPSELQRFLRNEQVGASVLLVAALAALVWANSPWKAGYASLWRTEVSVRVGTTALHADLRHAVNDGLMTLFFFVVGLEIKRELVTGALRSWRRAALPVFAALGGMIVPAALYLVLNTGQPGSAGWGVPIATDIAFAVGVFTVAGPAVASSLRVFLLGLAVVDDLGAIVVIAVAYASAIHLVPLLLGAGLVGVIAVLRRARVLWVPVYVVVGVGVWLAVFRSGVHATIAGAVLGLMTPAGPMTAAVAREGTTTVSDDPTPEDVQAMTRLARTGVSVAERLQHALHPTVTCVVLPLFALANAGVSIRGGVLAARGSGAVVAGIVIGLVVGKPVGITCFSWVATRVGVGTLPEGARWSQIVGVGSTAGIGFTVSLFVAELALGGRGLERPAKVGILAASLMASVFGWLVLRAVGGRRPGSPVGE